MPFTSFPGLCVLQRKNGLEGIDKTYMNNKAASTFIDKMMVADLVKVYFRFSLCYLNSSVYCLILLQISLVLKKKFFILDMAILDAAEATPFIDTFERVLKSVYSFFYRSPKRLRNLQAIASALEEQTHCPDGIFVV